MHAKNDLPAMLTAKEVILLMLILLFFGFVANAQEMDQIDTVYFADQRFEAGEIIMGDGHYLVLKQAFDTIYCSKARITETSKLFYNKTYFENYRNAFLNPKIRGRYAPVDESQNYYNTHFIRYDKLRKQAKDAPAFRDGNNKFFCTHAS